MNHRTTARESVGVALLLVGVGLAVARCTVACGPEATLPGVAAEAGYDAQQKKCIATNETRAAIDACRDKVKAAWAAKDAGVDQ